MAFKLTKAERKELADHAERLGELRAEVERKFEELTQALGPMTDGVNDAIRRYNEALDALKAFAEGIADEHRSAYDDKSETWQNGDRGQAADEFVTAWEGVADTYAEVDEISVVEPDAPELHDVDDLPEEAES